MTFTLGHANIQQTDNMPDELATVDLVHDHCDVATWNEARDSAGAIDALLGWDSRAYLGLSVAWNTAKLQWVMSGHNVVMQGGHVGADGKPGGDSRRVGPSRAVLWVTLREKATSRLVIVATHHTVAKADTTAKWRRGIRAAGWAGVVRSLRDARKTFPDAKLILTGDLNTIGAITAFVTLGIREARTPATHGRNRYDRIFGEVSNVRTLATRSDHKALLATVSLAGEVVPMPDAPVGPPPKVRALSPWRRYARRWRRRHPRPWRRIVRRWRRTHRRNR
jgi:hypothetical protein